MRIPEIFRHEGHSKPWHSLRLDVVLLSTVIVLLPSSLAQGGWGSTTFAVVGSQFHQRDPSDAGEARICIQNTGAESLSMGTLQVRILASAADDSELPTTEYGCVYVKLSPPLLPPGQCGEIVAKLLDRPVNGCRLAYDISTPETALSLTAPMTETTLWISYVGFSEDLQRAFVYVENLGLEPIEAELLQVGDWDMTDRTKRVHCPVLPEDKACLAGDLPSPLSAGDFVHVVIAGNIGGHRSKVRAVVRVIHAFPIVMEDDSGDSRLGLDVQRPFLETMACPAHKHGSSEAAAAKFLDDYARRFSETPSRVIQMAICRSDMPKAWFRFGDLPDIAAMNPCLRPPSRYGKAPHEWFCPFFCVADLAKRATEPGRYLAIIPTDPDANEGSLLLRGLTPPEWRFLVYCAVASGAKGIIYRGLPANDPLSRDAFGQLNRELQHLKPLLAIAEPIEWITTKQSNYAAKGLLCGNQTVLIIVFDCRYFSRQKNGRSYTPPFGRGVTPVQIDVRIPKGMVVQDVRTRFASLDPACWNYRDGALGLTAEMVDSVQVYTASLQRQSEPSEGEPIQ